MIPLHTSLRNTCIMKKIYWGGCILNSIMLTFYLVSFLFAVLPSLHPVTHLLLMSFILAASTKFTTYHRAAEVSPHRQQASIDIKLAFMQWYIWTIDSDNTLAALAEGSLTQASVQTPCQIFSGWVTKPAILA